MSLQKAQKLREERAVLIESMRALSDKAEKEERMLTDEERAQWDAMDADQAKQKSEYERLEREHDLVSEVDEARRARIREATAGDRTPQDQSNDPAEQRAREKAAQTKWIRFGMQALSDEERSIMHGLRAPIDSETRAQSTTTTAGGFTIAEDFSNELEVAMLAFGGMREAARIVRTATGAVLPWPEYDDTSNEGSILGENTQDGEQDITFAETQFDAYKYTSDIIRVSVEILQDSAFDFSSIIGTALAERLGRITNRHFTVGTGSSQPNGAVTASTAGVTEAGSSTVTHDNLLDLKHSVDPAYRASLSTRWMMHDGTLKIIKKLKDSNGQPLWLSGVALREPDTIDGDRYVINQHMPAVEAAAKSVLYGAFDRYIIREVRDITLLRLEERYADYLQVGFVAFMRADGDLVNAGTNPLKHLLHASP